jgi:hypothetical protein
MEEKQRELMRVLVSENKKLSSQFVYHPYLPTFYFAQLLNEHG